MKYACEIMADVVAKKMAEKEEKRLAQLEKIAEAMENFQKHIEEIDKYVEEKLVAGDGKAELMIDTGRWSCEGFWCFAEKDYQYSKTKPYWFNCRKTEEFPLELYIEYLREHCFTVEMIERPFTAYSSTLKSDTQMKGITLKISA